MFENFKFDDEHTQEYLEAFNSAPPEYTEIEDIEFEREYHLPFEFNKYIHCPVHLMPELISPDEIFLPITHSPLMPFIISGRYYVSNYGRIFDAWRNRIVISSDNGHGYRTVTLNFKVNSTTTKLKTVYVHRIVCYYFNYEPGCFPGYEVNHIDAIKFHNYPDNLEWVSSSENGKYRIYNNVINSDKNRGENQHSNSSSMEQVKQVCDLINQGIDSNTELHKLTGCSTHSIRHIKAKETWGWLTNRYFIPDFYPRTMCNLTYEQAENICKMLAEGYSTIQITQTLGVTDDQVSCIKFNGAFPDLRRKYDITYTPSLEELQ